MVEGVRGDAFAEVEVCEVSQVVLVAIVVAGEIGDVNPGL
jgi:hypothetical protein